MISINARRRQRTRRVARLLAAVVATGSLVGLATPGAGAATPATPGASAAALEECYASREFVYAAHTAVSLPSVSGEVTPNGSTVCQIYRNLGGWNGASIYALQHSLVRCYGKNIAEDGFWGPNTKAALVAVQRQIGVGADGVYGPSTGRAMKWRPHDTRNDNESACRNFSSYIR